MRARVAWTESIIWHNARLKDDGESRIWVRFNLRRDAFNEVCHMIPWVIIKWQAIVETSPVG